MFLWFLLRDEERLGGWQSGLMTVEGKRKPSFNAFRRAAALAARRKAVAVHWVDGEGLRRRACGRGGGAPPRGARRGESTTRRVETRVAVEGCTPDEPERHFLGWADEVDADELFASGQPGASASSAAPPEHAGRSPATCGMHH